jgi:antitoxin MazE
MDGLTCKGKGSYNVATVAQASKMTLEIIAIGNSKGIRIPRSLLEQCEFDDRIKVELKDKRLVLSAPSRPRAGWDDAFKAMAARGDDALLDSAATAFDRDEWEW